jgi:hypothetical protein
MSSSPIIRGPSNGSSDIKITENIQSAKSQYNGWFWFNIIILIIFIGSIILILNQNSKIFP